MKLTDEEKMALRRAASVINEHVGDRTCITCDCNHSLCRNTWIGVEDCVMDVFAMYVDAYIFMMDKCDNKDCPSSLDDWPDTCNECPNKEILNA